MTGTTGPRANHSSSMEEDMIRLQAMIVFVCAPDRGQNIDRAAGYRMGDPLLN